MTTPGPNIRADLLAARDLGWDFLRRPGTWLTGAQKLAIAAETRAARTCATCAARKEALSPTWVTDPHERASDLPEAWADVVHRLVTDPSRMTRAAIDGLAAHALGADRLDDAGYVELLGATVFALGLDTADRAAGLPERPLPQPIAGDPSKASPGQLDDVGAWVRVLSTKDSKAATLWAEALRPTNVVRALSLVPAQVPTHLALVGALYLPLRDVPSTRATGRALSRPQIELVASRVSALNECFY